MNVLGSFSKLVLGLQNIVKGKMGEDSYSTKYSQYLVKENRVHKEFQELSDEINVEIATANNIIKEGKQKIDILMCYKKIFSSLYDQTVD